MEDLRNGLYCLKNVMEAVSLVAIHRKEAFFGSLSTLSFLYGFEINKGLCDCCDVCNRAK